MINDKKKTTSHDCMYLYVHSSMCEDYSICYEYVTINILWYIGPKGLPYHFVIGMISLYSTLL